MSGETAPTAGVCVCVCINLVVWRADDNVSGTEIVHRSVHEGRSERERDKVMQRRMNITYLDKGKQESCEQGAEKKKGIRCIVSYTLTLSV